MHFSIIILATQLPSQFVEQFFSGWFRISVLCYGIFLNKNQMKPLEKSITLAVSLKVAVGNVNFIFNINYIFNIDISVNQKQNNQCRWRNIFTVYVSVLKSSHREVFLKKVFLKIPEIFPCNFIEKDCSTNVFLKFFAKFSRTLFFEKSANGCF